MQPEKSPHTKLPVCKPTNTSKEDQGTSQCRTISLNEVPTFRERIHYSADTILPKLALPLALLAGSAITAGTTYALVRRVQNLIATATVSSDPQVWMQQARTQAYDACYLGCEDCDDPNYAFNACALTARANVTGVICDGNRMWNWKDRYPIECLRALGEQFRLDALSNRKQRYRNQLAIIILTLLGGLVAGIVVYKLWKRAMASRKARAERLRDLARTWPGFWDAAPWTKRRKESEMEMRRRSQYKGSGRMKFLFVSFPVLFNKASAYACTGYDPAYNQYFVNANHTMFGVVHGWLSNCHDDRHCTSDCSTTCRGNSCSTSCTNNCWTVTSSNKSPESYVHDILPKIEACGFVLVDAVEGDVTVRVANAGIEKNWWVKIGVNGYNVTSIADTDEMIWCLYDIGN